MFIKYKMRYLVVSKKNIHYSCEDGKKNIGHSRQPIRDGSYQHPKHMLKLIGKKYLPFYAQRFCLPKPMILFYIYKQTYHHN